MTPSGIETKPSDAAPSVFLSYARADQKRARAVIAVFEQAGIEVWWDGLLEGGESFLPTTEAALESADAVVVLGRDDDAAALKAVAGDGFDVVLDGVCGPPLLAALKATRWGARILTIGTGAGPAPHHRQAAVFVFGHAARQCARHPARRAYRAATLAAQDLCSMLPAYRKTHHLQSGVGHYGVFNGKRWDAQIYPVVRSLIRSAH